MIAILHDYEHLLHDEPAWRRRVARLATRTLNPASFLERVADPDTLAVGQGPATNGRPAGVATYHGFCQSTNALRLGQTVADMLRRAGVAVADLPEGEVCCEFGGSTSLGHPRVARGIAERKLATVGATGAVVLASDNPGCILHLRGATDAPYTVRHFAELLAERLGGSKRAWRQRLQPVGVAVVDHLTDPLHALGGPARMPLHHRLLPHSLGDVAHQSTLGIKTVPVQATGSHP